MTMSRYAPSRYSAVPETNLAKAIKLIWAGQGRRVDPSVVASWERELSPHEGPTLMAVLAEQTRASKLPNLGDILMALANRAARSKEFTPISLSSAQMARSEHAAVFSMLWMAQTYPDLDKTAYGVLRAVFTRQFGKDADAAVRQAKETYTPEQINQMMIDTDR